MSAEVTQVMGWVATGLFAGSYFLKRPLALRATQMCGAALWILYGCRIHAIPVIVANALVLTAAGWTTLSVPRIPSKLR